MLFEFFKSIDLDDSGNIDGFEFQQALIKSDVGEYPPWEVEALVSAIDLDKDGKLNLPELSIALAQIAANYGASKADEPASADSEEPADEVDSQPTEASLSKLKKAELIAIAEDMGVATTGTKSDLVAAILGA
ncbi:MAG: EF-hand domain-containing protein [Candidatus Thermoplasmatota archaeon]|nr:EF-hand domain-containing protein [Candidatus Thermoplasmatota archaeon]